MCYQLPALALPGRTLVVSPLIALMKDQVDKLNDAGIGAIALNTVPVTRTKAKVIVELLKDAGMLRQTRDRRLIGIAGRLDRDAAPQLCATYRERAQRDRAEPERIAFYARTGFCRWKVCSSISAILTSWTAAGIATTACFLPRSARNATRPRGKAAAATQQDALP